MTMVIKGRFENYEGRFTLDLALAARSEEFSIDGLADGLFRQNFLALLGIALFVTI